MKTIIHYGPLPDCDICGGAKARYDAKTELGPWAYMCFNCYKHHATTQQLGTGLGQELTPAKLRQLPEWRDY